MHGIRDTGLADEDCLIRLMLARSCSMAGSLVPDEAWDDSRVPGAARANRATLAGTPRRCLAEVYIKGCYL